MNLQGNKTNTFIAIDLKSFYASVECVERGLDPLDTCLVVADESRTQKTICLAVSPALKAFGTGGRPRLFEVEQKVREVNSTRGTNEKSYSAKVLNERNDVGVDYLIALPRMSLYIDYSSRIYDIYLKYVAPEDIHVYSIDEVFIDVSSYLSTYKTTPHDLAMTIIRSVLSATGITATAGIGSNMYLAKIAMDIMAKKMRPDKDGVRIAELDEMTYRRELWDHRPLTDFWRVGIGIAKKLAPYSIFTMGDIARASLEREDLLYKLLGVNAELLIDHAWGWEPVSMAEVKAYRPEAKSMSSGQVLQRPYPADEARNVVVEMADAVSYDLIEQGLVTNQIVLTIGYDVESLTNPPISRRYKGKIKKDHFGREVPVHSQGTINFDFPTSSSNIIIQKTGELFDKIMNPDLLVRRLTLSLNHLMNESEAKKRKAPVQLDLFTDIDELKQIQETEELNLEKEHRRQVAILNLRRKFGKNVVLKGINYREGTTQKDRNNQIGGHRK